MRRIRIRKHEKVPATGSYEVIFPDGRASVYFYFDDLPTRRLRPEILSRDNAKAAAQRLARAEQDKLDARSQS